MQRPPRPEPTRLSAYFFQQVVSHVPHTADHPEDVAEARVSSGLQHQCSSSLRTETSTAVPATIVACSPSPSPPPSPYLPGVKTNGLDRTADTSALTMARADAGAPMRVTNDAATDAALWQYFTPASFRHKFESFLQAESAQTESLRSAVEAAWRRVEQIQQRNAARRAALADVLANPDAAWRGEVREKLYWQAKDVVQRYGFEVAMDSGTGKAGQADRARVTLDFSVVQSGARADRRRNHHGGDAKSPSRSASSNSSSGEDEKEGKDGTLEGATNGLMSASHQQQHQPMTASPDTQMTADDRLNPYARAHFLRRIFAPLQRARGSLPKWTTLLLHDVHNVQRAALPDLEKRVQESLLFTVPLRQPFRIARAALESCVQQRRAAPEVEMAQVPVYRQLEQHGRLWTDFVHAHESTAAPERLAKAGSPVSTMSSAEDEITDLAQRGATAEALWTLLFEELDTCKLFFTDAIHCSDVLRECVAAEMGSLRQSVHTHRSHCDTTVAAMKSDSEACAEMMNRNGQRIVTAVEEMEKTFISEHERLRQSIAQGEALLTRLEGQQEKSARRAREALKLFFMEQLKYEEVSQALLQDHLSLAQLEASHGQLHQAVQLRYGGVMESRKHAAALVQLLADSDTAVRQLFDACEAHCRRVETDNHFTQCRLADQCTLALQQHCRCLHAMTALYEQRYATLEARSDDSWQRKFLLSGGRDWAAANLSDVRVELTQLEKDWQKVCALRAELELEPTQLDAHVLTPEWQRLISTLCDLDAPPSLQRRLPTLRTHTSTVARPAAGCGQQAVRHLLRDAATAHASAFPAP
ncbi:hypothetical protein MNV84_00162 [Leishmania braziliensis]|nr:hypothetical protein MNV84_00162 [Leishmania braziliensis]CAJ2466186.1 unnamed protein product [Leishmania braziliensis]